MAMRKRRILMWVIAALIVAVSAIFGSLLWLLTHESGSDWLLRQVPGLVIEAPQGSVLGDFSARRLVYTLPNQGGEVRIIGLRWQGLSLSRYKLHIRALSADEVQIALAPSKEAAKAPTSLVLPIDVQIDALSVGRILQGSVQLHELRGALNLASQEHHVRVDALRWEQLNLSGDARIGTTGALPVKLSLAVQTDKAQGNLQAKGPLAELDVQAQLEEAGQRLQLQSTLTPFAPWPLKALQAEARNLNLQALVKTLPRTALSGTATLQASGWNAPATVQAQLSNSAAGRWDQGQLPVQSLHLALQARPDQPRDLQLQAFDARLLGGAKLSGQGQLSADAQWKLQLRLQGLRPEALDRRAAAMLLSGTAELAGAPNAPLSLTAKLSGDKANLDLQASLESEHVLVQRAILSAGNARAELQGRADQIKGKLWAVKATGQVENFEPRQFWAAAPQAVFNGKLDADLQLAPDSRNWPQGKAELQLQPSRWATLPLEGNVRYDSGALNADLALAGGTAKLTARLDGTPLTPLVHGEAHLNSPDLARLNPLIQQSSKLAGSLKADFKFALDPAFSVDGQASVQDLIVTGPLQAKATQVQVQLKASNTWDAPLRLNVELHQAGWAGQSMEQAKLTLDGSWSKHELRLDMNGRFHPPSAQASQPWAGQAHLALSGALSPQAWAARISRLQARADDPKLPAVIEASDLQLNMGFNSATYAVTDAQLAPGAVELGGARWRWSDLQWHAPRRQGALPEIHAVLELEPLAVAPLLARWQPDFGWSGDLIVGGSLKLNSADKVDVDALIERKSGDMNLLDDGGRRQALGLDTLRLALTAHDGAWLFQPELSGSRWGTLTGKLSAQSAPTALVPGPQSTVAGELKAQTEHVGSWGALLPPGWRLGGALNAQARLSGTLAAPHLLGQASGQGLTVRNPLLGVDLKDGAFQLDLDGASAALKSLSIRGGAGTIEASGTARLGAQPEARLDIKADHFAVLNRIDRRLVASGQAQLQLDALTLKLDGKVNVDEGLFDFSHGEAPTLGNDVYVLRPEQPWQPPAAESPSARKTQVNIALDLGNSLRLVGHGFESQLRGSLALTQAGGKPSVKGTVRTEGGNYAAYGQKLEIERGEVIFTGPYDNPRLDILALRANSDTRVGVMISGSAQSPQVKLYSDPEMADTDKLAWLLLGHGSEGLGQADTSILQQAALALLAGDGQSSSDKLIKNLGLDDVSVRQGESSADSSTRETIVHLGKQISKRWYVGYERSLNATTGSWQLIYRIAQRFTLRAQTGDDNALELIWQWKWQ